MDIFLSTVVTAATMYYTDMQQFVVILLFSLSLMVLGIHIQLLSLQSSSLGTHSKTATSQSILLLPQIKTVKRSLVIHK